MTENTRPTASHSTETTETLPTWATKLNPPLSRHQVQWVAAGLRRAAAAAGLSLPISYSEAVAADGLMREDELAVSPLGSGVVFHTRPATDKALPILLGYADGRGQWYRDGRRHIQPTVETTEAPVPGVAL